MHRPQADRPGRGRGQWHPRQGQRAPALVGPTRHDSRLRLRRRGRQGQDRGRRWLEDSAPMASGYAKDGVRLASDPRVRQGRPQRVRFWPAGQGSAQAVRHRASTSKIGLRDRPPAAALVSQQLRHLPWWLEHVESIRTTTPSSTPRSARPKENPGRQQLSSAGTTPKAMLSSSRAGRSSTAAEAQGACYGKFQQVIHDDLPYSTFLWADLAHRGYTKTVDASGAEGAYRLLKPARLLETTSSRVVNSAAGSVDRPNRPRQGPVAAALRLPPSASILRASGPHEHA